MTKLIINLDDTIMEKATRVAEKRRSKLDAMVRDFVVQVAAQDDAPGDNAVAELERSFRKLSRPMGGIDWTSREELYD